MAIQVSHVSKRFHVNKRFHMRDGASPRIIPHLGTAKSKEKFMALDDISLVIGKGETVGIIGENGSGKSTLLQIICGVMTPTTGRVTVAGRVVGLLELGAGFNPELTGRENVYINAAILGVGRDETTARLASIEEFSGVGNYIDQPVKLYSSGMVVRLAFSVAISVEPHILIIDEALAVGDELFQRKCYSRLEELKAQGTTILFVSHASNAVVSLCDRAILLANGTKLAEGHPKNVVAKYHQLLNTPTDKKFQLWRQFRDELLQSRPSLLPASRASEDCIAQEIFDPSLATSEAISYEPQGALISSVALYNAQGRRVNCLHTGASYKYIYRVHFQRAATQVRFGMLLKTMAGVELGGGSSANQIANGITHVAAGTTLTVQFQFICRLNPGVYLLNAGVSGDNGDGFRHLHRIMDALRFRVIAADESSDLGWINFSSRLEVNYLLDPC
ncbi:ABC transporter ATP-binding protein [Achromobacter aloeverae]|uniref:ABC transporter ATP-binding protein n=1 Tax=Achromobacter aloeverae TaxID=1750518 RepID=A0A4Q1HJB1_9BURK|nr:ABC transporter ATP-binding protein [Achromobacter aloeverae]